MEKKETKQGLKKQYHNNFNNNYKYKNGVKREYEKDYRKENRKEFQRDQRYRWRDTKWRAEEIKESIKKITKYWKKEEYEEFMKKYNGKRMDWNKVFEEVKEENDKRKINSLKKGYLDIEEHRKMRIKDIEEI